MDELEAYHYMMADTGAQIQRLNAEYDDLYKRCEELYAERQQALGDPGAYYDIGRNIDRTERRMEVILESLERLNRLREGV